MMEGENNLNAIRLTDEPETASSGGGSVYSMKPSLCHKDWNAAKKVPDPYKYRLPDMLFPVLTKPAVRS